MKLEEVIGSLDGLLRVMEFEDYPNALNGLQVENSGEVTRVVTAVDACESVLQMAIQNGADLLLVHHGLFWNGLQSVTGAHYRKLKLAIANNLALYSAHLPLDAHPEFGNNALLCEAIGLPQPRRQFLQIGLQVEAAIDREALRVRIEEAVGGKVHLAPGGPGTTHKIGVVTGGAGSEIFKAAAQGVDTFITGEGPHWSFTAAEELGINLFYAGHYATEVFGVQELGKFLRAKFGLPWEFLHHPTGL
ncbi:MAG TPA: Nif3-like dinuclear metal center hexameric protein [Terrimicrobiaceae bacterium]